MIKKTIILFLGVALSASAAIAQSKNDTLKTHNWFKHDIAGAAQIQVTYRKGNTEQLNQDLTSVGIPALTSNDIWINLSMAHYTHHWVMEDGLGFTPISTSSINNLKARYNQYQAYFRAGYDISQNSDFKLYPFVGINFSAAVLNIQDNARTQSVSNFTQEILNSTSSKTFYQPNFGIELGAGFDYMIKLKPKKMDYFSVERNIPIGVRAGYYINTYQGDWKIDSYSLNNGPSQKQSAVFVSLNIGLGYEIKKH
jgi:hypothetical protein